MTESRNAEIASIKKQALVTGVMWITFAGPKKITKKSAKLTKYSKELL